MTREEIFKGIQDIFRDIFDEDNIEVNDTTSSLDITDWDSLNHIILIGEIEKHFKIKFALGELTELKNVGAMVDLMLIKLCVC